MRSGKLTLSTLQKINLAKATLPFVQPLVFVATRIDLGNIFTQCKFLQLIKVSFSCLTYLVNYPLF